MTTFWTDRNVVVTGGIGFLGSYLVPLLEAAGARVFVPRSVDYDLREKGDVIRMYEDTAAASGRIRDTSGRPSGRGAIAILFHLAATVGGIGANMRYPADFIHDNMLMNALVCEYARRFEVGKLVTVGSVCAYPKFCPVPFMEDNLFAGYPEETNAPYGEAKRALLVHLQSLRRQYDFNGVYLIPTNLYGERDHSDLETSHVIPALVRKIDEAMQAGIDQVEVWGSGQASRDFLYVADCAEALMLAAERYDGAEPVNLGSGQETRIDWLVETLKRITGFTGDIVWDSSQPDGQPRRVLNTQRAWDNFGWRATTRLEDGLKKTVEWWHEQGR